VVDGWGHGGRRLLQQFPDFFRGPAEPDALVRDHDRALHQDRMRQDGVDQLFVGFRRVAEA
jgi:hypothetical protein